MDSKNRYPKRSEETASRVIDDEAVIVMPKEGTVKILNDTGAAIWELSDGAHSIEDIAKSLSGRFYIAEAEACRDILEFLEELKAEGMIQT